VLCCGLVWWCFGIQSVETGMDCVVFVCVCLVCVCKKSDQVHQASTVCRSIYVYVLLHLVKLIKCVSESYLSVPRRRFALVSRFTSKLQLQDQTINVFTSKLQLQDQTVNVFTSKLQLDSLKTSLSLQDCSSSLIKRSRN
jgi:hypothetical protein